MLNAGKDPIYGGDLTEQWDQSSVISALAELLESLKQHPSESVPHVSKRKPSCLQRAYVVSLLQAHFDIIEYQ